jgi:hypothetical protein
MTRGQKIKLAQQRRSRATRPSRPALRAHRLFVPILAVWGVLLGGLVTLVLPVEAVLGAAATIGLGALDELSRYLVAAMAALLTGGAMLVLGKVLASKPKVRKDTPSIAAMAVRHVRTIDPASELGSASLDAPVENMPFAAAAPVAEPAPAVVAEAPTAMAPAPVELDLADFAALPGRNAVWVVAPAAAAAEPEPAPEPVLRAAAPPPVSPSAIARLRAVPPSELSLLQMVERFAAALHEHQSAPVGSSDPRAGMAGRDAALAEALKALATLSRDSEAQTQSEPVRAALGRLQELRGAA